MAKGRMQELREEWRRLAGGQAAAMTRQPRDQAGQLTQPAEQCLFSPEGVRQGVRHEPSAVRSTVPADEWEELHKVYGQLNEGTRLLMKRCLQLADYHHVDLTWLARHIEQWDNYVKESEEEAAWFEGEMLAEEERQRLKEAHRARIREEMERDGMTTEQARYQQRRKRRRGNCPDTNTY
jgi:hypothetical protein